MGRPFLTARWEHLLFVSYACPPALLAPHVPDGTVLDAWQGQTLVSLVAFLFRDTRVLGIPVPGHRTFEEVNLRFYVRRVTPDGETRRAVVFLRELVPRRAIALVARLVYNEPYLAVPMRHAIDAEDPAGARIAYAWSHRGQAFRAWAAVQGEAHDPAPGSLAAFVTEHYWGYTRQPDGSTLEYRVEHPRWPVWSPRDWRLEGPLEALYGADMGRVLRAPPASVLAAPGSAVSVFPGRRLSASAGGTTAASGRQPVAVQ